MAAEAAPEQMFAWLSPSGGIRKGPRRRACLTVTHVSNGPGDFKPVDAAENAVAALLYTSGTTADPKGVMLTHGNFMGEVNAVFALLRVSPADAVLGILPMFHVLAQMANLMLPLVKGARVVYLETLNTTELLRALQERGSPYSQSYPNFFI